MIVRFKYLNLELKSKQYLKKFQIVQLLVVNFYPLFYYKYTMQTFSSNNFQINLLSPMLEVHDAGLRQLQLPPIQLTELEPGMQAIIPEPVNSKQAKKSRFLTPLNIIIILAVVALLGAAKFYFIININSESDNKTIIDETHSNIIKNAGQTNKAGSSTGSSTSKGSSSKVNNKPNTKTSAASKDIISTNPALSGAGGDEPQENEDDGDKREKKLKSAKNMIGSSTQEDSQEVDQNEVEVDDSEEDDDGIFWVDQPMAAQNSNPNVGITRPRLM